MIASMASRYFLSLAALTSVLVGSARAELFRVGPNEKYALVSDVTDRLAAGDIVEVTGDVTDSFIVAANGTKTAPIIVRGAVRIDGAVIRRPKITLDNPDTRAGITCSGDWIVIEGLEITGARGTVMRSASAVEVDSANVTLRNCRIHHNRQGVLAAGDRVDNLVMEFCEVDNDGDSPWEGYFFRHGAYLATRKPGAILTIEHCYFHDGSGGALLKTRFPRTVIRYNWFEGSYFSPLNIVSIVDAPAELYPMHCDMVGNVFDQGRPAGGAYCLIQLGGDQPSAPGIEGDFNIAHNLFITRAAYPMDKSDTTALLPGQSYSPQIFVHGNVDHVRLYNNVFVECGVSGAVVYEPGTLWSNSPRSKAFAERRGSARPVIDGSNNWISAKNQSVPSGLSNTLRGANPGFVDILNRDYRPACDSPLAGAALKSLPPGRCGDLVPAYEPMRGIPVTLRAPARAKTARPSIGPFEASSTPASNDGVAEMVLGVENDGTSYEWPLRYAQMRRATVAFLAGGQADKALEAAKAQFILCPPDAPSIAAAIKSVREALVEVDGNQTRATKFEDFVKYGPSGKDGRAGTDDDLKNPIEDVSVSFLNKDAAFYEREDKVFDDKLAVWHETWHPLWYTLEKVWLRLDGADFRDAGQILAAAVPGVESLPLTGDYYSDRKKDLLDGVNAQLSVIYRARFGTLAGLDKFVDAFIQYATYGPYGKNGKPGTKPALAPPL